MHAKDKINFFFPLNLILVLDMEGVVSFIVFYSIIFFLFFLSFIFLNTN